MDTCQYLPKNAEDYITCVRQLAALLHKAMDQATQTNFVSNEDRSKALQRLADGVETIACLRGDSGLFYAGRPENLTTYQSEMYQLETSLRERLLELGYVYPQR